ncbi:Sensor histidine kinase LiaS [Alkalibacterium sp. AK22]|uniref:sensor histidine kinase n=1 Tax=Alkalibacterium sp. AK22 TaxID=1229520 RepID=UPI000447ED72|nr:sensor histidine kinase [Alkalibacterium sp. AK22]EXJ22799.1 Sensor histidine kinase LiaS [Alkalibacterium sp. AK22]
MKHGLSTLIKLFGLYFLILLSITLFILLSLAENQWIDALYQANVVGISLVIYLLTFAGLLALITLYYMRSFEKKKLRKVEEGLRMMSQGHYSASIFMDMYSLDTPLQISEAIDQQFIYLHEKLMFMADQALQNAQEHRTLNGEEKEEILIKERHRLARELHDSVSQQLFAASMMLSAVNQQMESYPGAVKNQLELVEQTVNASQTEMRALLLHLRPIQLDGKSLKEGIEQLLKELESKTAIAIHYAIEQVDMHQAMEDHFFRIIQELLSNVLRHAQATELELYLNQDEQVIKLSVMDNGIGFDAAEKKAGSYGLTNIRERIEGLGGNVRVVSLKKVGTRIEISVPSLLRGGVK